MKPSLTFWLYLGKLIVELLEKLFSVDSSSLSEDEDSEI